MITNCSATQVKNQNMSVDSSVDAVFNTLVEENEPGVQYVVVSKDRVLYEKSRGLAYVSKGVRLDNGHTLAAFSMTKVVTAIAILQLVERNLIGLDDRVADYVAHPYGSAITIRQLLGHTAGLPDPIPLKWVHLASGHKSFNEEQALRNVLQENAEPDSTPGEMYQYSNIGYWLLGHVIEDVSQMKYTRYVTENIFEPLKLTPKDIGFLVTDQDRHARGYLKKWSLMNLFGRFLVDTTIFGDYEDGWLHIKNVYLNGPSFGGAVGTARAFGVILQDMLAEKSLLVGSNTRELLFMQQTTKSGTAIDMTLGWHMDKLNSIPYYYKEGGGAGYRCEMRIYPTTGIASVLMSNRTKFDTRSILSTLDISWIENQMIKGDGGIK